MRRVFIDDLPKYEEGRNKGNINWSKTTGDKVSFIYDDIKGIVLILGYNIRTRKLKIQYNKKIDEITTSGFIKCGLGNILNKYSKDFKIEIGTNFKDDKRDITITDREYRLEVNENGWKINRKWYKYKCNICGWTEGWKIETALLNKQKQGCSCCHGTTVVEGVNDIATTDTWMIPYIGEECAKTHTHYSSDLVQAICPDCGRIKSKKLRIYDICKRHKISCSCEDGQPYPEKYMFNVLEQLGLEFKTQLTKTTFEWCEDYKYDFYFKYNNELHICEVNGIQHYKETNRGRSLKFEQENDIVKKELALKNEVKEDNYIVVDGRYSELDYIKNSILNNEKIKNKFDLSVIDWIKAEEFALTNLCKKVCDLKRENPEITVTEISQLMKMGTDTVRTYLKTGNKLKWCKYIPIEEQFKNHVQRKKRLIDINTGIVFDSISDCKNKIYKMFGIAISRKSIADVCNQERLSYQGYIFKYIDNLTPEEYIKYDIENKLKELHNNFIKQDC